MSEELDSTVALAPSGQSSGVRGGGGGPFGKELLPFERYNWLYHSHFVQNDFATCIEQMERLQVESEYCLFLKGLIKLRQGNAKSALQQFNLLKSVNNTNYIKVCVWPK